MYTCPIILYFDLDVNDEVGFPYVYHVSKGTKYDSAIVFFQESHTAIPYPIKYVRNISFSTLMKKYGDQTKVILRPSRPTVSYTLKEDIERTTILYLATKRITLSKSIL